MAKKLIDQIIVTSDEPWCEIWHTQLHYAFQLSKRTNVIYLGPPEPWKFTNLFKISKKSYFVNKQLVVATYHNLVPSAFGKLSLWINDQINSWLLKKYILGTFKNKRGIVWHFDPRRSYFIFKDNPYWRQLFHVIDPIADCNLDNQLARLAELIVVTSPKFLDHYRALNHNVIQIAQGVDLEFYNQKTKSDKESFADSKDSIILLGTITEHINFSLLKKIAERFPSKLILIGPNKIKNENAQKHFDELLEIPGVKWLGAMPPADFRYHLMSCRVGIIAYDQSVSYKNNFRSPLKVISYLACGNIIISNIDCEIPSLVNQAIYNVSSDEEYFDLIEQCYRGQILFMHKAVQEYLQSIEYSNLLSIIFENLSEELPVR